MFKVTFCSLVIFLSPLSVVAGILPFSKIVHSSEKMSTDELIEKLSAELKNQGRLYLTSDYLQFDWQDLNSCVENMMRIGISVDGLNVCLDVIDSCDDSTELSSATLEFFANFFETFQINPSQFDVTTLAGRAGLRAFVQTFHRALLIQSDGLSLNLRVARERQRQMARAEAHRQMLVEDITQNVLHELGAQPTRERPLSRIHIEVPPTPSTQHFHVQGPASPSDHRESTADVTLHADGVRIDEAPSPAVHLHFLSFPTPPVPWAQMIAAATLFVLSFIHQPMQLL